MLSIGKVGAGQASPLYYVESVAQGAEDYYSGHGEAPGRWTGKAAAANYLTGTVHDDEFLATLRGDGEDTRTVLGYDLTFSAPKSVSILFGVGDDELSSQVRSAHDDAVEQALGYLEQEACWTRRGAGGARRLRGDGFTVAAFRHRTSRAGDPQLHTHAVVANATEAEGRTSAIDGRALYAHAKTAGYLYQAALRAGLTEHVGVEWLPVENGTADIRGIDQEVLRHFSRRSEEIRELMAKRGERTPRSARAATLETRRAKSYDVAADRLRVEWRARAAELGFDRLAIDGLLDRRAPGAVMQPDLALTAEAMTAPGGITLQASTFDRRDVLRDWAEYHREGVDVARAEQLADRWLASHHSIKLEESSGRAHLGGARHTTPDMLRIETEFLAEAKARKGADVARLGDEAIEPLLVGSGLFPDQEALVRRITTSGDGVEVIRAAAGTGKTRALGAARSAWEKADVHVVGCALAARAAVELEALAGIDSTTVAQLQRDLDAGYGLRPGSVLVVDEAGMVGTRAIARLAAHCSATDSKLLLVGDDHQLPEIDAGGAFRGLAGDLGAAELTHVRRQSADWDRDALDALRRGRVGEWAEAYRDHGRLFADPDAAVVRRRLAEDWWQAAREPQGDAVMVAHRRTDVAELNALARERMLEDGRLSTEKVTAQGQAFAVGDVVLARRNDRRLGVVNGTRGRITELHEEQRSVTVETRSGDSWTVDAAYLDSGALQHGYALTAHAAQGATVARSFVLGSDDLYREWGYTALTRHREEARFYVVSPGSVERALPGLEPSPDPLVDDITATLGRSRRKTTATEILHRGHGDDPSTLVAEAEQRAAALEAERAALKPWQRGAAKRLSEQAAAQRDEAARWAEVSLNTPLEQADDSPRSFIALGVDRLELSAARTALLDPPDGLVQTIGSRPSGLRDRDRWLSAAARLIGSAPDMADRGQPAPLVCDTGLEL